MAKFSQELFDNICHHIGEGRSLRSICAQSDMPTTSTFMKWVANNKELAEQYQTSRLSPIYKEAQRCKSNPQGSRANSVYYYRVVNSRETNKKKHPISNIYIAKLWELNIYKIGVSQNVNRRLRDLNAASPFEVVLVQSTSVSNAYDLELKIHETYKSDSLKGEWFHFTNNDVTSITNLITQWQDQ